MTVCLRCDWEGEGTSPACPRCGARLYRSTAAGGRGVRSERSRVDPASAGAQDHRSPGSVVHLKATPWRVLSVVAALTVALVIVWTQLVEGGAGVGDRAPAADVARPVAARERLPLAQPIPSRGRLGYASESSRGRQSLWVVDLETGRVSRGPRIPLTGAMIDGSEVGPDWIGITGVPVSGTGAITAYMLRGTDPDARLVRLGSGDLLAWDPRGRSVAFARRRPLQDDGRRAVTIRVLDLRTGVRQRVFFQSDLRGDLLSLGRDGLSTYFTRQERRRLGVFSTGVVGVAHPVLRGYGMVSVSPVGDFLLTPASTFARSGTPPLRTRGDRGPDPTPLAGTVLFWRGRGGPIRLGNELGDLVVEDVLAWAPDGSLAIVVGQLDYRTGLFLVAAGPGTDTGGRVPTFVVGAGPRMGAAFSDEGVLYLAINGNLFAYRQGMLVDLLLPKGAPRPAGPLVWLP